MKQLPLSGITVVSIEHAIAAPFCTRQLADFGARVIKVERTGTGDFARGYDERVNGISSHFVWTNRSKESIALDLKSDEGSAVLHRLIGSADVFIQNLPWRRRAHGAGLGEPVGAVSRAYRLRYLRLR